MRVVISCADIGSIANGRFGWARSAADETEIERHRGGTEIVELVDGVAADLALPDPVSVDPDVLSDQARVAQGIRRLPTDLQGAVVAAEASALLREALGDMLLDAFLAVRRYELEALGGLDVAEAVRTLRWRYA